MKKGLLFIVLVLSGFTRNANGQMVEDWVLRLHEARILNDMPCRIMKPLNFDPVRNLTGNTMGSTLLSSDRCDPEPVLLKWLFNQKLPRNN